MKGFYFNIQYGQDLRGYLEIFKSRFPDETVKNPVDPVRKKRFKKNSLLNDIQLATCDAHQLY